MATQSCASQRKQLHHNGDWYKVTVCTSGAVWQRHSHPVALDLKQALPVSQHSRWVLLCFWCPAGAQTFCQEDIRCKEADPLGRSLSGVSSVILHLCAVDPQVGMYL